MVHVFPYSKRKGTPAATMPNQIPEEVKRRRLHDLEAVVREIRAEILREEIEQNPITEVLFETYTDGIAYGHTADFLEIAMPSPIPLHAERIPVRLTHTDGQTCFAEPIDQK
jgi:threonylcarbamoyladenosine tRNA methylthiotransferase MtaB